MRLIIFILLTINLTFADSEIWISVKNSTPIYKTVKKVIPTRICKENRHDNHSQIVKRCKKVKKVVYEEVFDGYENIVKFKSNGKRHKYKFKTNEKVHRVKLGIVDYR